MNILRSVQKFHDTLSLMNRPEFIQKIRRAFEVTPTVALLGPRQCGKTTLARAYIAEWAPDLPAINYFDLEDPASLARLDEPMTAADQASSPRGSAVTDTSSGSRVSTSSSTSIIPGRPVCFSTVSRPRRNAKAPVWSTSPLSPAARLTLTPTLGCAISQASASLLTDEVKGRPVTEIEDMTNQDILDLLGIEISPARLKCALLSLDTLRDPFASFRDFGGIGGRPCVAEDQSGNSFAVVLPTT